VILTIYKKPNSFAFIGISILLVFLCIVSLYGQNVAPDFTLRDVNPDTATYNTDVSLSDYQGLITILFFFQTSDDNCIAVAPLIEQEINLIYGRECTAIIGISGFSPQDSESDVGTFAQSNGLAFPVLYDPPDQQDPFSNVWPTYYQLEGKSGFVPLFVIIDNMHSSPQPMTMGSYDPQDYLDTGGTGPLEQWFISRISETIQISGGADDSTAPTIDRIRPPDQSTLAYCDVISVEVSDDCAIDAMNQLNRFQINNDDIDSANIRWNPPNPISNSFTFTITVPQLYFAAGSIDFQCTIYDLHGNPASASASFVPAQESDPPLVENPNPPDRATDVPLNAVISLDIVDDESCVDENTISFFFGERGAIPFPISNIAITPLDDGHGFNITYDPTPDLKADTVYNYFVNATNLAGLSYDDTSPNFTIYEFTTVSGGQQGLPTFTNLIPRDDDTNASSSIISFDVTERNEGIDPNTITLTLNGDVKTSTELNLTQITDGYSVSYTPGEDEFPAGAEVEALAFACTPSNICSNSDTSDEVRTVPWSFTIGDPDPPEFSDLVPGPTTSASINTPIAFKVNDKAAEVDRRTITLEVNQQDVTGDSTITPETAAAKEYLVYYKPAQKFSKGETVSVRMSATDTNDNTGTESYTFTTQTGPVIQWAGYLDTFISRSGGGFVKIVAKTADPKDLYGDPFNPDIVTSSNIVDCRLFNLLDDPDLSVRGTDHYDLANESLVILRDDPVFQKDMGLGNLDRVNDGLYVFFAGGMPKGIPEGQYGGNFAIQAMNATNDWTDPWPYFTVLEAGEEPPDQPDTPDTPETPGGSDEPSVPSGILPDTGCPDVGNLHDPLTFEGKIGRMIIDSLPDWRIEAFNWINSTSFDKNLWTPGYYPPVIYMAGIEPTRFASGTTEDVTVRAFVFDPDGDIKWVKLLQGGNIEDPSIQLFDDGENGDFDAGDNWYGAILDTNITPGFYKIEIVARDDQGNYSHIFPYITVDP